MGEDTDVGALHTRATTTTLAITSLDPAYPDYPFLSNFFFH
jgi:hypothetical protein